MNFYEVKVGKTSRRGHFESFNSFVAKTEMSHSQLHEQLRNSYKGFEIALRGIETIEEFKKETVVKKEEEVYTPIQAPISYLKLSESNNELTEDLENLRLEMKIKEQEFDKLESKFREDLSRHLVKKHSSIANGILNLKKTSHYYQDFDYELRLKGNLKTLLENN